MWPCYVYTGSYNAMDNIGIIDTNVIAINNTENYVYDSKVIAEIRQNEQ